jgi:hypothetical protein
MARRKNWSTEKVVAKLRQIEIQLAQGKSLALACKEAEISEQAPGRVPEAGDLLQLTGGAGGDRRMEEPLQQGATSLLLGLPATCTCHPAGQRAAAPHTSRHAVVSLNPVQNPGQASLLPRI